MIAANAPLGIRREWFPSTDRVLDLGVGDRKRGTLGVDIEATASADVVADARELPFAADSFDAVVCYHLAEHLTPPDLGALLESAARVCRPEGRLYLLVDRDVSRPALMAKDPTHVERYAPEAVRELVSRHFTIGTIQTHNLVGNVHNHLLTWWWYVPKGTKVYVEGVPR